MRAKTVKVRPVTTPGDPPSRVLSVECPVLDATPAWGIWIQMENEEPQRGCVIAMQPESGEPFLAYHDIVDPANPHEARIDRELADIAERQAADA